MTCSLAGLLLLPYLISATAHAAWSAPGTPKAQTSKAQIPKAQVPKTQAPGPSVPLNLVAAQVVATLDAFNAEAESRALPKLSKVVFDFNTGVDRDGGLNFNILFFRLGTNRTGSTTNEVTFTYTVPSSPAPAGTFGARTQPATHDFSQTLLSTLEAAAAQVQGTQRIGAASFSDLTVTLSYGVVWDVSGGGTGTIALVTLDGSVDRKRSDVQTLTLTFGQ